MTDQQNTKLTYAILTTPNILQIKGDANLILTISNNQSTPINVTQLVFEIPVC